MNISELYEISQAFCNEIKEAAQGKKNSLPFLVHQLSLNSFVEKNEIFEVLRIGGSIYQKALVEKKITTLVILAKQQARLPKLQTAQDFFQFIEKYFEPDTKNIALNFAYPLKPVFRDGKLDGQLLMGSKEHAFKGLVGKNVGEEIEKYVYRKSKRKIHVSVANDTVCLLLSGLTKRKWNEIAAGVVGTGLNFAIFLDKKRVVNLESAYFDKFTPSEESLILDKKSKNKGLALYEKETTGAYLYQHYNLQAKKLGLGKPVESTLVLDAIAKNGDASTPVAQELFDRSAALIACQMAGITLFYRKDLTFVMEGSLFWDGWKYKDNVDKYLKILVPKYKIKFKFIEDSGVLGAAKLIA